jgi:alanyl-tRNA synthetase
MTERLYYDDCYTTEFSATITEHTTIEERPAVILDRTYFYPTGGGQPNDTGIINGVKVVDVVSDESGENVVHVLESEIDGDEAACVVDWERRLDLMQHHTGQHILTRSFIKVCDANTVGFHMSDNSLTIDLDSKKVSTEQMMAAEQMANSIIWQNLATTIKLIDPKKKGKTRVRRMPDQLHTGGLRVLDIGDFDSTACGGTHVANTGEIGIIKVLKLERRKNKTRVEFRCGKRALLDFQVKNTVTNNLMSMLTCGAEEVEAAVERLRDNLKRVNKANNANKKILFEYEITDLLNNAPLHNDVRLIKEIFDGRDVAELRALTNRLIENKGTVVMFGVPGEKVSILMARSDDLAHDMNILIKHVLPMLGNAGGGGRPNFAQGGGVRADKTQVEYALQEAERVLFANEA